MYDREALKRQVDDCLQSGSKWVEEFRILHPQHGKRWLAGLGRVLRDAEGRVTGMAGINIDVTARKTAEEAVTWLENDCAAFLYTHVDTEGTMTGFPIEVAAILRACTAKQLIVAGGIKQRSEIDELDAMGVDAVAGMAVYSGAMEA